MPRVHNKSKPYWYVTLPRGRLVTSRDVTWADIQACITALNATSSDVFAGLHRCEGGFMCVNGANFKSEDRVDTGLPHQNPTRLDPNKMVHKEIRFGGRHILIDWPSSCGSFLDNDHLTDDWVVLSRGFETELTFQGEHCVPWTRKECETYARTVAQTLDLKSLTSRKRRRV